MPSRALYLGDDDLGMAASYLAGSLHREGFAVEHVTSKTPVAAEAFEGPLDLVIVSDYPGRLLSNDAQQRLAAAVGRGTGLLAIGGWESYSGAGGDWEKTILADLAPVEMLGRDDRVHLDGPCLAEPAQSHPIIDGLPWFARPPLVGGYNRLTPKADATVVLQATLYDVVIGTYGDRALRRRSTEPLLIVRDPQVTGGRVACLATDVAPHWIGPWVDWGDDRVAAQAPGAAAVEVGSLYAEFIARLCRWTANLP
ncbi:MAG TPA: glutamine amidotransferase [Pirellulaceae bacterium]|jgi:hypothetical protein|nr:glutamine amidotransferase [Pirellulaceae bacterium]